MKTLRIGILVDSPEIPRWVRLAVESLSSQPAIHVVSFMHFKGLSPDARIFASKRLEKWDEQDLGPSEDALSPSGVEPLLPDVPEMTLSCREEDGSVEIDEHEANGLVSLELDVLLYMGRRRIRGALLRSARSGLWMVGHGRDFWTDPADQGFSEYGGNRPLSLRISCALTRISKTHRSYLFLTGRLIRFL